MDSIKTGSCRYEPVIEFLLRNSQSDFPENPVPVVPADDAVCGSAGPDLEKVRRHAFTSQGISDQGAGSVCSHRAGVGRSCPCPAGENCDVHGVAASKNLPLVQVAVNDVVPRCQD